MPEGGIMVSAASGTIMTASEPALATTTDNLPSGQGFVINLFFIYLPSGFRLSIIYPSLSFFINSFIYLFLYVISRITGQ